MIYPDIDNMAFYRFVSECSDYFFRCVRIGTLPNIYAYKNTDLSTLITTNSEFVPYGIENCGFYLKYAPNNGEVERTINAYYNYVLISLRDEPDKICTSFFNGFLSHLDDELRNKIMRGKVRKKIICNINKNNGDIAQRAIKLYALCRTFLSSCAEAITCYAEADPIHATIALKTLTEAQMVPTKYMPKRFLYEVLSPRAEFYNYRKQYNTLARRTGIINLHFASYLQVEDKESIINKLRQLPRDLPTKMYGAIITVLIDNGTMRPIADGERGDIYRALCNIYNDGRNIGTRQRVTKYICTNFVSPLDIASANAYLQ